MENDPRIESLDNYMLEPVIFDLQCDKYSKNGVVKFKITNYKNAFESKKEGNNTFECPSFLINDFVIISFITDYALIDNGGGNYEIHFIEIKNDFIITICLANEDYKTRTRSTMVCVGNKPIHKHIKS